MRGRALVQSAVLAIVGAVALGMLAPVRAQSPADGKRFVPPRTADGKPDLQGIWNYASMTPLERPDHFKGKAVLSEAEAAEFVKKAEAQRAAFDSAPPPKGDVGAYNQFWMDAGQLSPDRRTSLIIDPPDGRLPALTPEAEKRKAAHRSQLERPAEGPEQRDASERCILGYNSGPPMSPVGYNQNMQLVQTRDNVVIFMEMVHDARIVRLSDRPPLPSHIRPWMGDSQGRWEGDTLVVVTKNFSDKVWSQYSGWNWASDENLTVTERFSLVGPDRLQYEYTVEDPTVWTRPWTARYLLPRSEAAIYEYACHEANHGMIGILRGARLQEGTLVPSKTP